MNKFETALKKYLDIFANQEMYFVNDLKNLELFKKYPLNINADDIRIKLSAINDTDISQNTLMEDAIAHILTLKIDERIKHDDLSVVEDLAHITSNGRIFYLLHFASVYCNFHKPEIFPVYSEQHIDFYKKYIKENNLSLDPEKINTYDVFSKALNDLLERWGLTGKMNYLHIRKFGWLYAETVVKEANA
ncbi:MAG TPA: hypothetical protein PLJ60_02440 [Chryseolinea sp.]|nr:hypothetical protein [Chryseolinea sp.]HPM29170.1 hypothetical protein [Chryseolinea sp.]